MTTLASDNFTRANQVAWGLASDAINTWSQPVAADTPGGTESWGILSNGGQVLNTGENVMFCGTNTAGDVECHAVFYFTNSSTWLGLTLRASSDATTCYQCILANGSNLYLIRRVASSYDENIPPDEVGSAELLHGVVPSYGGKLMHMRFRANGNNSVLLLGKTWKDGDSEPDWQAGFTDAPIQGNPITADGYFGVYMSPNNTSNDKCFSFLATDTLTGNEPDGDEGGGGGGSTSLASVGNGRFARVA